MNHHAPFAEGAVRFPFRALGAFVLACLVPFASGQPATGSISGRVQNEATGQYLGSARITVKGTDIAVLTDEFGSYRIAGVPSGAVTLEAFYSGLDPVQATVEVRAGQATERDLSLTSRANYGSQGGTVKLDPFVLSSSKLTEGEALATNEQRFAANIKNVVATDAYGDVTEGNVAEFMKYLPGITVDYSDVMPLAVSVRGFDPSMTNVTSDGATLANASRNGTTRQFDFMQVSINNISRIEVTKVPTPANPASGISGSVNMVSKSAFERSRAQLNYRVFVSASSDGMQLKKQPFPFDTYESRVKPGFDFDYTLPITKNFGLVMTALHSKAWNEQNISQTTWNGTAANLAAAGASPAKPVLVTYNLIDAPKWYERNSAGLKADWRVTPDSVLSVGLQATYYIDTNGNVSRTANVGNFTAPNPATGTPLTYSDTFTRGATGRGTVTMQGNLLHIDARTLGSNLRYRFNRGAWSIDAVGHASTSKTWLRLVSKGHFNTAGIALRETAGVRVNFEDIRPERPGRIEVFDAANRPVDLNNIRNFRLNTATNGTLRDHRDDTHGGELNVKRSLRLFETPFSLQAGASYKKQDRDHQRRSTVYTYNPPNPADPTPEPFLMQIYRNRPNYFGFDNVPWVSFNRMVEAWDKNPSLFTTTAAQQVAAEQSRITNHETFRETTPAYYVQAESRFFSNRLLVLTGVRYEEINTRAAGPLFDPDAAFVRNPDGSFARVGNTTTRVRKPEAGAAGSLEELRLIRRELGREVNSGFDGYYPSLHLTYNVTPNFLARAAYARTYGKADFNRVIPNTTIDENESFNPGSPTPGSYPGVLIVGNPALKPWLADNFDLSAEYYTETGGVLSFGVYRKELADFHADITGIDATPALLAQLGLDPGYAGWEVRTTVNGGDARVDGMEANLRQSLAPLGSWGRMFSVFANGTRLRLLGSAGGRSSFSRFIPRSANWGFTITRRPVTLMLKWNHRGEQRQAASAAQGPDAFLFQAKRTTTDINLTWQLHRYVSLFVNGRNIFNVHYNLMRYGSQTPGYAKISSTNSYGAQWSFGFKGTF